MPDQVNHSFLRAVLLLTAAVIMGLSPMTAASGWELVEVKKFGSQSTKYFAARAISREIAIEIRRKVPNGDSYEVAIDAFVHGFCEFTTRHIQYRIDHAPLAEVDVMVDCCEAIFPLSRSTFKDLREGKTLFVDREPLKDCLLDDSPLWLEYSLTGLENAVSDMDKSEFVVDFTTITIDGTDLLWRSSESEHYHYEGTVTLSSMHTDLGYPMRIGGESLADCEDVTLEVDGKSLAIEQDSFTPPQIRTNYHGWVEIFIDEDAIAQLRRGDILTVHICALEGTAELKFDLLDFDRAWLDVRLGL